MLALRSSLSQEQLASYVSKQLNGAFPDGQTISADTVRALLPIVMERMEHCFSRIRNKYFFDGQTAVFNHLHGDQYAMFLYLAANTAFRMRSGDGLSEKLFLLNKMLHGLDAYFEIELPSVFLFVHPLATVLGRARYADYLLVYQRCGIGSNHDIYPSLGEFVTLRPGSAVLGECSVGRNCTLAAESLLLDRNLPNDTVYFGNPRDFATRAAGTAPSVWRP